MTTPPTYLNQSATHPPERLNIHLFHGILTDLTKRALDLIIALIALVILSPVFLLISILIKRDSPGPIFYRGMRAGRGGRPFGILKFRTMYECPESYQGPRVTGPEDKRVTPLGHWLRDTKLNELPQFWNVLVGKMSLVGPRPEDPEIVRTWPEDAWQEILSVRPGITSPASIVYHREEKLLSGTDVMAYYLNDILPDKMRLDRLYVRNHSFQSDLDLILWTAFILVARMAKVTIPEGYLFAGPITFLANRYVRWFLVDVVTALGAVGLVGFLWRGQGPLDWGFGRLAILAVFLAILFSAVNSIVGLNRIVWSRATAQDAIGIAVSGGFVTFLILLLNHLQSIYHWLPYPPLPEVMILSIGLVAQMGFLAARYRWGLLTSMAGVWLTRRRGPLVGERVLIVGAGEGCQIANWLLRHQAFGNAFSIVGLVDDDDLRLRGMRVHGSCVLGGLADLASLIEQWDVGLVLFSSADNTPGTKDYVSGLCEASNIRLVFLDQLLETVFHRLAQPVTPTTASAQVGAERVLLDRHENVLAE